MGLCGLAQYTLQENVRLGFHLGRAEIRPEVGGPDHCGRFNGDRLFVEETIAFGGFAAIGCKTNHTISVWGTVWG